MIYTYECLNGHRQEVLQTLKEAAEDPRPGCPFCSEHMSRVPSVPAPPQGGPTPKFYPGRH